MFLEPAPCGFCLLTCPSPQSGSWHQQGHEHACIRVTAVYGSLRQFADGCDESQCLRLHRRRRAVGVESVPELLYRKRVIDGSAALGYRYSSTMNITIKRIPAAASWPHLKFDRRAKGSHCTTASVTKAHLSVCSYRMQLDVGSALVLSGR
jgi:hypothetical protein